jgi:hypothetical protein
VSWISGDRTTTSMLDSGSASSCTVGVLDRQPTTGSTRSR